MTTFCASFTGSNATIHSTNRFTTFSAGFANCCTQLTQLLAVRRITRLKIYRELANSCAIQHQAKMFWLHMFSARRETMIHCHLQAHLMTLRTVFNARFHVSGGDRGMMHGSILPDNTFKREIRIELRVATFSLSLSVWWHTCASTK